LTRQSFSKYQNSLVILKLSIYEITVNLNPLNKLKILFILIETNDLFLHRVK